MRKNVASQVVAFQAVSATDGSAVTSGTPVVYYTIDGGTQGTGTATPVHEGNGQWSWVPTQAETNGNHLAYTFTLTGCIAQTVNIYTVSFDPHDTTRLGISALPNAAAASNGGLVTGDGNNRIAGIQGTITTLDALDTAQDTQHQSTVNLIGSGGANLTAVPWNAAWDAEVQSEVQDAIEVNHLDHLLAAAYDPASKPGAADALLNELVESDAGVSRFTANALEQAPSGGLDAAGVRAAIGLASANLDTQLADIPTVAEFEARTLAAASYFDPSTDVVTANVTQINGTAITGTGSQVAAAFEHFFDVATPSKTVNDVGVAGSGITAQEVRDAMKLAPSAGAAAAGSIDAHLDDILEDTGTTIPALFPSNFAALGINVSGHLSRVTLVDTTTTNTDMRGTDSAYTGTPPTVGQVADAVWTEPWAGQTANALQWGGLLYQLLTNIQTYTGTDIPADIANLNDLSAADVNAQIVDVLSVDTFAEPSGVPAATATIVDKIGVLYAALRNKVTVTATKKTFFDDADNAEWEKDITDDGTTYTESEGNAV